MFGGTLNPIAVVMGVVLHFSRRRQYKRVLINKMKLICNMFSVFFYRAGEARKNTKKVLIKKQENIDFNRRPFYGICDF